MVDLGVVAFPTLGTGADGHVTISSNTDLGSSNIKNYTSLVINSSVTLQGNDGMIILVQSVLTNNGTIHTNGKITSTNSTNGTGGNTSGGGGSFLWKGGNGGNDGTSIGGVGAAHQTLENFISAFTISNSAGSQMNPTAGYGGGALRIRAYIIIGTGTISSNGTDATATSSSGGGSGGYVECFSITTISNQTIHANGGAGATRIGAGSGAGGGGAGGIIYLTSTSFAGTTSATGGAGGTGTNPGLAGDNGCVVMVIP